MEKIELFDCAKSVMAIMIQGTVTQTNHCEKNLGFNAFLWFLNKLCTSKCS